MPFGHTRKLSVLLAILVSLCLPPALAEESAEHRAELSGGAQENYLAELKRRYGTQDERRALLAHVNRLLDTYAMRAGYQVGQAQRQDLLYRISVSAPGELLVREESRAERGTQLAVRNQRVPVFGVDPFVRYDCPASGPSCVLRNPLDGSPLLTIVRDHAGAAELAKAFSFLIRNVQKS
ncbi:hypothetical protein [Zestomonas thermotolerans]|uniref:hypothetical protein n=1 Tax=Zestomonas thermotolerans TaxID=157784 RepID=UPI0003A33FDE|nr:hypothetical protein [Pseudomonas thermotolerans]MBO2510598.1 hypothetical protein [Gammaproteobacteria bacterium]